MTLARMFLTIDYETSSLSYVGQTTSDSFLEKTSGYKIFITIGLDVQKNSLEESSSSMFCSSTGSIPLKHQEKA